MAVHRPALSLPMITGVQPVIIERLSDLKESHNLTSNRGNIVHAEAPARIFEKDAARSAHGNIAMLHRTLGREFATAIAGNFDIIVLSMANFIRPNVNHTSFVDALKQLQGKVPFIVLGAGLQGRAEPAALSPSVKETLSLFNDRALIFGVRGKTTESWLHANGFKRAKALGCPSLYSFPQSIVSVDSSSVRAKGPNFDVMTAGYATIKGGHNFNRGVKLVTAMKGIAASYVLQDEFMGYGALAEHVFSFDEGAHMANAGLLNEVLSAEMDTPVEFKRYYYFTESSAWRQASLAHDIYAGDRFHGGVAALQAGQPAIFLSHDVRVSEMCDFFSLPRLTIDELTRKGIKNTVDEYLSDEAVRQMKKTYRSRHRDFQSEMARHGINIATQLPDK